MEVLRTSIPYQVYRTEASATSTTNVLETEVDMSAGGVADARPVILRAGGGASPTSALHNISVRPIDLAASKMLLVQEHYLHSLPGGTKLAFGVFLDHRLLGVVTFGVGPYNAHRLVVGAGPADCLILSRLWLSDDLPRNSESRVLGVVMRSLRHNTTVKFVVTYADPMEDHVGTIYQATGWTYTGLSEAMPLYDIGDGKFRHSRSLAHAYGTHSVRHFQNHGVAITTVPQSPKHRYLYFLDCGWRPRLNASALPYPKRRGVL